VSFVDDLRPILYPVARTETGSAVHIDAWERGVAVTCFGCGEDLIGRLPHDGIKPTAHFAHKADGACSGETALHKAAKAAIVHARSSGTLSGIMWTCPRCKRRPQLTDLSAITLHEETRPCEGVTSDVLGLDVDGAPRLAIEVVVTHDLEPETLERYRACGFHVFTWRPSWRLIGDLTHGSDMLRVDYRLGEVDEDCAGCRQVLVEKLEWEAWERKQKAVAWWKVWITTWQWIGKNCVDRHEEAQRLTEVDQARQQAWWAAWSRMWGRHADQISHTWWGAWDLMWRTLGAEHVRPYRWWKGWLAAWREIGKRFEVDETERQRRLSEIRSRYLAKQLAWWPDWLRVWSEIGERASGRRAAWKPICRNCRQDLTPDHRCP
jgi:hypothetical protein